MRQLVMRGGMRGRRKSVDWRPITTVSTLGATVTPPAQLTDAQLLQMARAGDAAGFDELYRRHFSDASRVARIVTDDNEEAEEVVAEAFSRILATLHEGSGPDEVLTPHLRTVIRRLAVDRHRRSSSESHPADPAMLAELPTADDDIVGLTDRTLVRAGFESLPERWQRVLWHTEIEGRPPARLTPALGSTPNAVAALAYRAREGLRQAFLAVHLAASAPPLCRPYVPKLAGYTRQTLSEEEDVAVAVHLDTCAHCRDRRDELLLLLSDVRSVLAPALLGTSAINPGVARAAPTAIAGAVPGRTSEAPGGGHTGETAGAVSRRGPRGFVRVAAMSIVSAAAAGAVAFAAMSAISPSRSGEHSAAPPAVTSGFEPAQTDTQSMPVPSSEPADNADSPSPTDEPSGDDESVSAEVSRPTDQSPTTEGQSGGADGEGTADAPAERKRSGPKKNSQDDDKADEPASKADSDPDAPKPGSHDAPGSNDTPGNKNPGTPPPSPWACEVVTVLPWCD